MEKFDFLVYEYDREVWYYNLTREELRLKTYGAIHVSVRIVNN